jgi:hypothetical protein
MMVVVIVMVMIMVVIVMMVVMIIVMVMMMVVLSYYQRLFFRDGTVTALVLSTQNLLGVGNRIQQLGKGAGGLQHVGFVNRGRS